MEPDKRSRAMQDCRCCFDAGPYPGQVLAPTTAVSSSGVKVQLLQIGDTDGGAIPAHKAFDDYEEFNPVAPKTSKFIRRYVRLADSDLLGRAGAATSSTPSA